LSLSIGIALAREQVILQTGFRIQAEHHETAGDNVRLYTKDGVIEIPESVVAAIEQEEIIASAAAPQARAAAVAPPMTPVTKTPRQLVDEAAEKYGLPREFLHSVARAESAYHLGAVSPKGAIGVMQLMPGTAAELAADPRDPAQNIDAGARHLRDLLVQYNGSTHRALAAYNAGPGAVAKYGGVPPYRETVNYVEKVLRNYQKLAEASRP